MKNPKKHSSKNPSVVVTWKISSSSSVSEMPMDATAVEEEEIIVLFHPPATKMAEALLTSLSMENHHNNNHHHHHNNNHHHAPSTLLSMDSGAHEEEQHKPLDINFPLSSVEISSLPSSSWLGGYENLDVVLGSSQIHETESLLNLAKVGASGSGGSRKCARWVDSIWGTWFFFSFYFKPALTDKTKKKLSAGPSSAGPSSVGPSSIGPVVVFD